MDRTGRTYSQDVTFFAANSSSLVLGLYQSKTLPPSRFERLTSSYIAYVSAY